MEATTQYFEKQFFCKQVLESHRPSKLLCQTSGRQNHWSLLCTQCECGNTGGLQGHFESYNLLIQKLSLFDRSYSTRYETIKKFASLALVIVTPVKNNHFNTLQFFI
jgi:hypothetical protein